MATIFHNTERYVNPLGKKLMSLKGGTNGREIIRFQIGDKKDEVRVAHTQSRSNP
jgi:hypothetical protein